MAFKGGGPQRLVNQQRRSGSRKVAGGHPGKVSHQSSDDVSRGQGAKGLGRSILLKADGGMGMKTHQLLGSFESVMGGYLGTLGASGSTRGL